MDEKRPLQNVVAEVIKSFLEHKGEDWLAYKDLLLLGEKTKLKMGDLPFNYGWLPYKHIKELYDSDKKFGFRRKNSEIEELLLGDTNAELGNLKYKW